MKKKRIVMLDGYNVINRVPALRNSLNQGLESARNVLAGFCLEWKSSRRDVAEFIIVFDGNSTERHEPANSPIGVRILFSEKGETADDRIRRLLEEGSSHVEYVVVSDDSEVRRSARANGASAVPAKTFFQLLRGRDAHGAGRSDADKQNLTDVQKREINEHLKRAYNIK